MVKTYGWKNRSGQVADGGPWYPDLFLVQWDGGTRTDIQVKLPDSVGVFATAEEARCEASRLAVRAAQELGWDIQNGLIEVTS